MSSQPETPERPQAPAERGAGGVRVALDPEIQRELDAHALTVRAHGGLDPQAADSREAKDAIKEAAVKHSRHWVRLTRLCNQRCIFCLDSWNHNGTYIDTEQLLQYIDLGVALGRERLILSGGEPTIHPDYIKFIRRGREAGYDWVQTVTNGMMFAYPKFTRKAIQAGLNEVTVSIHGHTPKLQDKLVGVKGAFDKAVQGIRNIRALSGGRTVVNIDIVINKQNVSHLRDIIDFFRGMGIHEFDLLYIVPFGRGFADYRRQLFFNLDDHHEDLQRALEVSREPGVFIWTNRLPPEQLENFEDLIQDPHKLHSEVQGGLHNFEGYLKQGTPPDCHGERCEYCFLKGLCHDHMFMYRERLTDGAFERVRVDLEVPVASERAAAVLDMQRPQWLHVQGATAEDVRTFLAGEPYAASAPQVVAEGRSAEDAETLLAEPGLARVAVRDLEALRTALGADLGAGEAAIEVEIDAETVAWLVAHEALARPWIDAGRLIARLPNFEYISEVRDNGVGPDELAALRELGVRLMNVPRCVGGARAEPGGHFELSREMLDADGNLGVTPYVQRYIMGEYMKKRVACRGCVFAQGCRGMHINFLRTHGFSVLQPITEPGDADA